MTAAPDRRPPPVALLDLDRRACEALVAGWGFKPFHGRNLFKWLHKHGVSAFDAMTDLPLTLRERLAAAAVVAMPSVAEAQPSPDGTLKWVLELADGQRVETVYIPEPARATLCVSSQIGCALACRFCATARQGFNRNLSAGEIIAQVRHATQAVGRAPTNVVMMGMGEPLANFDAVVRAMDVMQDDFAYMLAKTRVTLSTSGVVPNIYRLAEVSDVSLAVSLHAPDNALRDELVPINRKYPLEQLIPACRAYLRGDARRRITWEYVMLAGVNDSDRHANQARRRSRATFSPTSNASTATSPTPTTPSASAVACWSPAAPPRPAWTASPASASRASPARTRCTCCAASASAGRSPLTARATSAPPSTRCWTASKITRCPLN